MKLMKMHAEFTEGLLESTLVRVHAEYDNKAVTKTLEIDDFCKLLSGNVKKESIGNISSGILPEGTFYYEKGETGFKLGIYVPGGVHTLNFKNEFIEVPFPASVMLFSERSGLLAWRATTCKSQKELTKKTNLYHWPFGHVYDDGHVCVGNVQTKVNSERKIPDVIYNLYTAENSHANTGLTKIAENVALLEGKEYTSFPNEMLVDAKETLKTFLKMEEDD